MGSMYERFYRDISSALRRIPRSGRVLNLLDKGLVCLIAGGYVFELCRMLLGGDGRWMRFALVPAAGLAICTAIRAALNAPRPYELFDVEPLIEKRTAGKSLPSRHVFSAAVIACAIAWIDPAWGAAVCAATVAVAAARVLGGVHFIRDVAAALALALIVSAVGFCLI